jgi:hypothetical protein
MVALKDIALAINKIIINGFMYTSYNNVEIQSNDIKKGFERPCFYVEFEGMKKSNFNLVMVDRNITARIYYFPTDRNKYRIELLEVQEILEKIFNSPIMVNESFAITVDEINSEIIDGVMQTSFDLYTVEIKDESYYPEDANLEDMEELEIEQEE